MVDSLSVELRCLGAAFACLISLLSHRICMCVFWLECNAFGQKQENRVDQAATLDPFFVLIKYISDRHGKEDYEFLPPNKVFDNFKYGEYSQL